MLLPGKNKDALRLLEWVEHGLHDAVEKGFLDTMTFGLSRDADQKELIEQFKYNFSYDVNGVTMADSFGTDVAIPLSQSSQGDMKTVKYQIVRMMRMLIQICTTLGALPEERYIFMKLTYTEATPDDYEPPFFRHIEDDGTGRFSTRPFSMDLGMVKTNYHGVMLSVRSVCDPLIDGDAHRNREGEGQTSKQAMSEGSLKASMPSQKAALEELSLVPGVGGREVSGEEDSVLMTDLIEYCHEGGKSRVDLAGAMAKFRDADAPSLKRCFDALVIKGTLATVPDQAGKYVVSGNVHTADAAAMKTAAVKPAASASSRDKSQDADMHHQACGAGSCRTLSTGQVQAQNGSTSANMATTASMPAFVSTQDSNRQGRKRRASLAEAPIFQNLMDSKLSNRLRLLKMQRKV
ncbi:hypothetical protein CVIRNUC_004065 [Coccomyxa viridis]|uniref:HORMA domain-containing protein n=1 Tax=Coccomyxa viridis TaxID=1274662 RepID=A0AAV1I453_9CHLO|nr:hypothetical protein CVIRNUC_004065 [Coccomyxa viridis]